MSRFVGCRYGSETLSDIENKASLQCTSLGFGFSAFQSNHEGALVDRVHAARIDGTTAIVINAGAYTHTSVAIRDALSAIKVPFIEVHVSSSIQKTPRQRGSKKGLTYRSSGWQISNVHARESFRHHSYLSDVASGVIVGLGSFGYTAAIGAIEDKFKRDGVK